MVAVGQSSKSEMKKEENSTGSDRSIVLERAKARGVVFGYRGKRPHHETETDAGKEVEVRVPPYQRVYVSSTPTDDWMDDEMIGRVSRDHLNKGRRPGIRRSSRSFSSSDDEEDSSGEEEDSSSEFKRKPLFEYFDEKPKEWKDSVEARLHAQDISCAEVTLARHNSQNKIKYDIIETVDSFRSLNPFDGLLYHCNFWAKPTFASATKHKFADRSPKLFFSELVVVKKGLKVKSYCILDGKDPAAVERRCFLCAERAAHPVREESKVV